MFTQVLCFVHGGSFRGWILHSNVVHVVSWNEIDWKVQETNMLMGLKVHRDGVKKANSLKWPSAMVFVK